MNREELNDKIAHLTGDFMHDIMGLVAIISDAAYPEDDKFFHLFGNLIRSFVDGGPDCIMYKHLDRINELRAEWFALQKEEEVETQSNS